MLLHLRISDIVDSGHQYGCTILASVLLSYGFSLNSVLEKNCLIKVGVILRIQPSL